MNIHDFEHNIGKRQVSYRLGVGSEAVEIERAQARLGIEFPYQVRIFYENANGLYIESPNLEILPLEHLKRDGKHIVLSRFNCVNELSFLVSKINSAEQWDIINRNTGFFVTRTMASFWSNKVFAWLRDGREIWARETYT